MVVESTTLSEPLNEPLSVAVSRNVYVPAAFAVNDGVKVVALVSVDPAGPERTVQEYVSGSPSGSEAVPERTYGVPMVTLLSAPAFAVGARLVVESTTLSEPLNEPLSVAVSRNVYVPAAFAVNDGVSVVALVSVDPAGPERTVQEYVSGSPSGSEAVPERT